MKWMRNAPGFYSTNPGRWTVRRTGKTWRVESDVGAKAHAVWGQRPSFKDAKAFAEALAGVHGA